MDYILLGRAGVITVLPGRKGGEARNVDIHTPRRGVGCKHAVLGMSDWLEDICQSMLIYNYIYIYTFMYIYIYICIFI